MGIQTMGSQSNGQQSHLAPCQLTRQNSWYSLTLNQVENQLKNLGKPLTSMNLDDLLKNVWSSYSNQSIGMAEAENTSLPGLPLVSGKTVDQVWREIQHGQKKRCINSQDRQPTLGEMTLENFLVEAGLYAEESQSPVTVDDDDVTPQNLSQKTLLPQTLSTGNSSDSIMSGRKRGAPDALEKAIERRLRRKIKNRESAARSRARKQAYHNELVGKVSRLEEQNLKLKKEKEFEKMFVCESLPEQRYQLRRTSSAAF